MRFFLLILIFVTVTILPDSSWAEAVDSPDLPLSPPVQEEKFQAWLDDIGKKAVKDGIRASTVNQALGQVRWIPRVVELDRKQAEFRLTLARYLQKMINTKRTTKARKMLQQHRPLLAGIHEKFSVPGSILVALWGIESNFGRVTGGFPVIDSLATLAYEGRRRELFTRQLLAALHIFDQGHIQLENMKGSWAGAMGQVQFMPTTFRHYAYDYDGDGKKDIWNNTHDALASAANYLAQSGWKKGLGWGFEVTLPKDFDRKQATTGRKLVFQPISHWRSIGVTSQKPAADASFKGHDMALIIPDRKSKRAFLVSHNFDVLMKWNRSFYFGIAVAHLAEKIEQDD